MNVLIEKLFRNNYPETYFFILLPLATLAVCLVLLPKLLVRPTTDLPSEFAYYILFGWGFLSTAAIFLYYYLSIKFVLFLARKLYRFFLIRRSSVHPLCHHRNSSRTGWMSIGYIFLCLLTAIGATVIMVDGVYHSDPSRVAWATQWAMQLDKTVFGSYVPFALQTLGSNNILSGLLFWSYSGLSIVLSVVFLIVLFTSKVLFRKFMFLFLLIPLISIPVWFVYPVISPSEMYRDNKLNVAYPPQLTSYVHQQLTLSNPQIISELTTIDSNKSNPAKGLYGATAFPSMHVAWGTAATYIGILAFPILAIVLVPWWILNTLGAVYVMQHFAVDVIAGVVVFLIALAVMHIALRYERRYSNRTNDLFSGIDIFQNDMQRTWDMLKIALRPQTYRKLFSRGKNRKI